MLFGEFSDISCAKELDRCIIPYSIDSVKKENYSRRFQLLLSEQELDLLRKESELRGIGASELIRIALRNETARVTHLDRLKALKNLMLAGENHEPY